MAKPCHGKWRLKFRAGGSFFNEKYRFYITGHPDAQIALEIRIGRGFYYLQRF